MHILLFDDPEIRVSLLPLTYTRPVSDIRVGILTITGKWELSMAQQVQYLAVDYLTEKYPGKGSQDNLLINGALCPSEDLVKAIKELQPGHSLVKEGTLLAYRCDLASFEQFKVQWKAPSAQSLEYAGEVTLIKAVYDIFGSNGEQIIRDYLLVTGGRESAGVQDPFTRVYAPENVFVEEGAVIKAAIINAERGPVYIGKNSEVHEGAIIKGPFALCEHSNINVGAKIRGDTTVGPFCKVGGEVSNSVIFGHSNKGHEGFMGNSVIGEWCNLGADTNTSNLKNNYGHVKLWNFSQDKPVDSGLQFCGLIMGDHCKSGINTMFNTGTVAGVNANIFGAGYPPTFIPSFSWGGADGLSTYRLEKAIEVIEKVCFRRQFIVNEVEKKILNHIFEYSSRYRTWENI